MCIGNGPIGGGDVVNDDGCDRWSNGEQNYSFDEEEGFEAALFSNRECLDKNTEPASTVKGKSTKFITLAEESLSDGLALQLVETQTESNAVDDASTSTVEGR